MLIPPNNVLSSVLYHRRNKEQLAKIANKTTKTKNDSPHKKTSKHSNYLGEFSFNLILDLV